MRVEREVIGGEAIPAVEQEAQTLAPRADDAYVVAVPEEAMMDQISCGPELVRRSNSSPLADTPLTTRVTPASALDLEAVRAEVREARGSSSRSSSAMISLSLAIPRTLADLAAVGYWPTSSGRGAAW